MNQFLIAFEPFLNRLDELIATGGFVFFALSLSALLLLVALVSSFRSRSRSELSDQLRRYENLGGRIERLEQALNTLRTESLRSIVLLREEVKKLKGESDDSPEDDEGSGGEGEIVIPEEPEEIAVDWENEEESENDSEQLSSRLTKTRSGFFQKFRSFFSREQSFEISDLEQLEEHLITADLGVQATKRFLDKLQEKINSGLDVNGKKLREELQKEILSVLQSRKEEEVSYENTPHIIMLVGVNGSGKTTTAARLARRFLNDQKTVLLVAADTFRAAATEQLQEWGKRLDIPVVSGAEGARPQTVVYDAMEKVKESPVDVVIIDTAGRLHTKSNLMQELEGVRNTIEKHLDRGADQTLLVVDGSSGQNALQQAREFHEAVSVSGLVITKLDGTPKGGIVVAIRDELGIPIRYIGVGESESDLREFETDQFVAALFDEENLVSENGNGAQPSAHARKRRKRREDGGGELQAL